MSEPFIGEIRMWACNYAPQDWAFCNGQTMLIQDNTALFAVIGTIYGGDGRTSFKLPNLADRTPMHWGTGPGLTPRIPGEFGGSDQMVLSQAEMPVHNHVMQGVSAAGDSAEPTPDRYLGKDASSTENIFYLLPDSTVNTQLASECLATTGNSQGHQNEQPFSGVNFCIALNGLFPSRS